MTLVNVETAELITEADVDASIARVIQHAESIWDEWVWQVENRTWLVKGFGSWDEMRGAVYSNINGVAAPRAERPELVARFRSAGLTQQETADTLGVTARTIKNDEHPEWREGKSFPSESVEIVDAEFVDDDEPASAPSWRAPAPYYRGADPGPEPARTGQTEWSRRVQTISAQCPMETLTDDEVTELLGATTFLRNYCQGELTTRRSAK